MWAPPHLKIPLILLLLLLGDRMFAGESVVFGEKDVYVLDQASVRAAPREADRLAFLEAIRADVNRKAPLENTLDLVNPPDWGKTVSMRTHGTIQFHPAFPGGFACRISLENLLPEHDYILTLNGNPARAGNRLLASPVPGNEKERYYDFLIIKTDARGHYDAGLGVYLTPGSYDVRCYVKDTADFKIVLYHDYFPFEVK
jgi:hypothetical protein